MENGGGGTTEDRRGSSSYQVMRMAIAIGGSRGIEGEIPYSPTLHFTGWS
jgi:hypothetical protein